MNNRPLFTFSLLLLLAAHRTAAIIVPGELDDTFGGSPVAGLVATDFFGVMDWVEALAVQPDGKIVAAGKANQGSTNNFGIARYHADGSLDTNFGSSGLVALSVESGITQAHALILQPDGKIVAAGQSNGKFALVRLHNDGTPDSSFNTTGVVTTNLGSNTDTAFALALQPDGKLVAAGMYETGLALSEFALVRYNQDGTLDTSFGPSQNGIVITTGSGDGNVFFSVRIQPDGKIVAGGKLLTGGIFGSSDFCIIRYNTDGTPDTNFGTNGIVTTDLGSSLDIIFDLALQPDGCIVAVGRSGSSVSLARYHADGSPDTNFGNNGTVVHALPYITIVRAVQLQPDNKIVIAGSYYHSQGEMLLLARYLPDGTIDSSFGGKCFGPEAGFVTTGLASSTISGYALVLLPDQGKLIAGGGYTGMSGNTDFLLARYHAFTYC
jgi:uncharacterized delta-60 repeat protein